MLGDHRQERAANWAEELQDGPLQGLAAMKMLLGAALEQGTPQSIEHAAGTCLRQIEAEIGTLRTTISEMR